MISLINSYSRINEVAGITITIAGDGAISVSLCMVNMKGSQLDIAKKVTGLQDIKQLSKHISSGTPVAVNVTGKGVLIKQVEKLGELNAATFSKVLPNARIEDFYLQNFVSGDSSFVALIRQTEADKWMQQLTDLGFNVLLMSLGPFAVQQVLPQLSFYGQEVVFDGHQIVRNEQNEWVGYRYVSSAGSVFPIKLETEKIDEKLILSYAAAFQLVLADNLPLIQAEVPSLSERLKTTLADRKLTVYCYAALAALFILLLGNFLLFSHYNSANTQLAEQVGRSNRSVTDVESLQMQIKTKEALLDTLGWDGGISKAALVDQVAQLLPPEISWQELAINPVGDLHNPSQKSIRFLSRTIRVTGYAQRILIVNEWISRIKSLKWAKDVQLQGYSYDNELNTGQFTIMISY